MASAFLFLNQGGTFVPIPFALEPSEVTALLLGGGIAAGLGAIDDLFDLRARWQLLGQLGLALVAVALGVTIDFIANPFGGQSIRFSGPVAAGFTVFWIVGMINSINLIDGLDGLSSGIALIAAVTLGLISLTTQVGRAVGQPLVAVLCFALAGALLGFLRWNFHPASIFAGTSGVQFVGYTLAVLSILGTAKVAVALLVLGVPIIDTFWIIVRRALGAAVAVHPGPDAHPPPAARPRACRIARPSSTIYGICLASAAAVDAAVGRHPAVRVPRHLRRVRPRPLPADPRRLRSTRRTRGGSLRTRGLPEVATRSDARWAVPRPVLASGRSTPRERSCPFGVLMDLDLIAHRLSSPPSRSSASIAYWRSRIRTGSVAAVLRAGRAGFDDATDVVGPIRRHALLGRLTERSDVRRLRKSRSRRST